MTRNLTIPTVIRELNRVSTEHIGVNVFESDLPVSELVRKLAVFEAFKDIPEIAGQLDIDTALNGDEA